MQPHEGVGTKLLTNLGELQEGRKGLSNVSDVSSTTGFFFRFRPRLPLRLYERKQGRAEEGRYHTRVVLETDRRTSSVRASP